MRVTGRDTSACVINWGGRAIISLDSVLQLHQLSLSIYSRKKENGKIEQWVLWKYFNTLKKYFAFWENIYIIVVFIFCCCEVSVNYVGLDTFNRLLAPGQSGQSDRFSMTNLHYSELRGCQGGATQTRVLAIQGNRHWLLSDDYERGGAILKLKTVTRWQLSLPRWIFPTLSAVTRVPTVLR